MLPDALSTLLVDDLAVDATATRNFAAATVSLSGAVTMNGVVMPDDGYLDSSPRGWVRFVDKRTGDAAFAGVGELGAGNWSALLFAGSYDVFFDSNEDYYQTVLPDALSTRLRVGCLD